MPLRLVKHDGRGTALMGFYLPNNSAILSEPAKCDRSGWIRRMLESEPFSTPSGVFLIAGNLRVSGGAWSRP